MSVPQASARRTISAEYQSAWLSWVSATTGCIKALGSECTLAQVAGFSGYAFHQCIHPALCPSAPNMLDWDSLNWAARFLGRAPLSFYGGKCHTIKTADGETARHCKIAFEIALRETEAGRPCVIWGAYIPEFAIVVGTDADSYIVDSFKRLCGQEQPPVKFDELDAPGGIYVLAFPESATLDPDFADRWSLSRAVELWSRPNGKYNFGADSYDAWISALRGGTADGGGNAYNAACFAEAKCFAAEFLFEIAARRAFAEELLKLAATNYSKAAAEMKRVAEVYPFPGEWGMPVNKESPAVEEAAQALDSAKEAEVLAMNLIKEVVAMDWPN